MSAVTISYTQLNVFERTHLAFDVQDGVAQFHRRFQHPVRENLHTPEESEAVMAYEFIEEELWELRQAMFEETAWECGEPGCCSGIDENYAPDLIEVADALGDIVFVAYGMALRFGIDLDRVLAAITESNMTKEPNGQGKIRKGEDYVPPKISEALGLGPVEGFSPAGLQSIGVTEEKVAA